MAPIKAAATTRALRTALAGIRHHNVKAVTRARRSNTVLEDAVTSMNKTATLVVLDMARNWAMLIAQLMEDVTTKHLSAVMKVRTSFRTQTSAAARVTTVKIATAHPVGMIQPTMTAMTMMTTRRSSANARRRNKRG